MNLIGENTGLTIGVVVTLFGGGCGAIWWAASMQAKLDQLLVLVAAANSSHDKLRAEVEILKDRVTKLELSK